MAFMRTASQLDGTPLKTHWSQQSTIFAMRPRLKSRLPHCISEIDFLAKGVHLVQLLRDFISLQPSQWQPSLVLGSLWVGIWIMAVMAIIEGVSLSRALIR